jgi:hypothetical protein
VSPARRALTIGLAAATALGTGCAFFRSTRVSPDATLKPGDAVVIGKLGFPGQDAEPMDEMEIVAVDEKGKRHTIDFDFELSQDGRRTAPFFARLPPGRYQLRSWAIEYPENSWAREDTGLDIVVEPGVVCVGAVYVNSRTGAGGLVEIPEVRDECADIAGLLRRRAPALSAPPQIALAKRRG